MREFIHLTDGYKLDHRRQYPRGTEFVLSNFTARGSRIDGQTHVVFAGLQGFLSEYFMEQARTNFFNRPRSLILKKYEELLDGYFGPGHGIGTDHIGELHDLGYIPLKFCALPEGTDVPLGVPMFTIENTLPEFFWLTNYFETLISSVIWPTCTSATTAKRYRKILDRAALETTGSTEGVQWQGHDFSFRGMMGPEAAALSGIGHLLFFTGTDCLPAVDVLRRNYHATELIAGSVPATEHSVMCAGSQEEELETYDRLLDLYPKGILSVVSDTWDLWNVLTVILPQLKPKITAREGKLVIRPDSGDPVKIICGDPEAEWGSPAFKGVIELLWELFGGTGNYKGYKVLDSHIGAIYGDSITEERASLICVLLKSKGFASTNVVFGIGSYTYQFTTRDVHGFAIKATWTQRNGVGQVMQKAPVTGHGKKSARGRLAVIKDEAGELHLVEDYTPFKDSEHMNLLQPVWENGKFLRVQTLADVRKVAGSL